MAIHNALLVRLALGAVMLTILGCNTVRSASDYDPTAKYWSYTTFALLQRPRDTDADQTATAQIRDAIERRLQAKGFTLVSDPARAELIVDYTVGAGDRVDARTYPVAYEGGWFWSTPLRNGPYWGSEIDRRTYRDGILSIDIFNRDTHRPIWHGWSKVEIQRLGQTGSGSDIGHVVRDVLSEYPPGHMQ